MGKLTGWVLGIALILNSITLMIQDWQIRQLKKSVGIYEDGVLRVKEVRAQAINIVRSEDEAPSISLQTDEEGIPSFSLVDRSNRYPDDSVDILIFRVDNKERGKLIQGIHEDFKDQKSDNHYWPGEKK